MSNQVAEVSPKYLVQAAEAAKTVVPEGYQQTEVGAIPEEWDVVRLQEVCRAPITYGIVQCGPHVHNGIPYIRVLDMNLNELNVDEMLRTSPEIAASFARSKVELGDIVYALRGKLGEVKLVGSSVAGANLTQGTARVSPARHISNVYLFWVLRSPQALMQANQEAKGSTFLEITLAHLKRIKVAIPRRFEEQAAIANALSDVDALISELEKLIAKKQVIKTATMQQLLTGRTRLPQFALREDGSKKGYKKSELGKTPEDWDVKPFGELFEPVIARKTVKQDAIVSFVGMHDVTENAQLAGQTKISFKTIKSGFTYFQKDDVLVAKITPCFENGKGCHTGDLETDIGFGSTEFHVLRARGSSNSKFIYFWTTMNPLRITLESEMVGSAGHRRVPFVALQNYLIQCPPDKTEQTAIATILSDMDDEIQALEQRLAKTRQIKQGMMQELLTGKTRLI